MANSRKDLVKLTGWLVFLFLFSPACGTRVGNPQQPIGADGGGGAPKPEKSSDIPTDDPDDNPIPTLNLVALPKLNFDVSSAIVDPIVGTIEIPDPVPSPISLQLTDLRRADNGSLTLKQKLEETIAKGLNTIPLQMAASTRSINSLTDALNTSKFATEGSFFKNIGSKKVSGTIKKVTDNPKADFEGLFCIENQPFAHYKWKIDGNDVEVHRSLKIDPFIESNDPDFGVDIRRRVVFSGGEIKHFIMQNDGAFQGGKDLNYVTEIAHADSDMDKDGNLEFRALSSRRKADQAETVQIVPDNFSSGRYNKDGSGRVLFHDSLMRLIFPICQTKFAPETTGTPGWCFEFLFGPKISNITTKYSARESAKIPNGDLEKIGVAKAADLKRVEVLGVHSSIVECPKRP